MLLYVGTQNVPIKYAPLAQPDRVFGYEPKGQGFESLTARHKTTAQRWFFCVLRGVWGESPSLNFSSGWFSFAKRTKCRFESLTARHKSFPQKENLNLHKTKSSLIQGDFLFIRIVYFQIWILKASFVFCLNLFFL